MLPPFCLGYVKGWRRALAALICIDGVKSLGTAPDDLGKCFKDMSFIGIHAMIFHESQSSNFVNCV